MTRLRGRAPRGRRLLAKSPHGHWRTTTMISSVRLDGSTACMTIEGATDTAVFQAYVREILGPSLRPGDIVVMDNLGAHKNEQTLALLAAAGATVRFLPAYSPDLNPIEMMWIQGKDLAPHGRGPHRRRTATGHRLRVASGPRPRCPRLVCRLRL